MPLSAGCWSSSAAVGYVDVFLFPVSLGRVRRALANQLRHQCVNAHRPHELVLFAVLSWPPLEGLPMAPCLLAPGLILPLSQTPTLFSLLLLAPTLPVYAPKSFPDRRQRVSPGEPVNCITGKMSWEHNRRSVDPGTCGNSNLFIFIFICGVHCYLPTPRSSTVPLTINLTPPAGRALTS